jgi:hypothetical protein
MISLLNVTKPGCMESIFKMAAILDFCQMALYPILFSISISIIVPNIMLVTESAIFFHHFLPLDELTLALEKCKNLITRHAPPSLASIQCCLGLTYCDLCLHLPTLWVADAFICTLQPSSDARTSNHVTSQTSFGCLSKAYEFSHCKI